MTILITVSVLWVAAGAFQLYAIAHHGQGVDYAGIVPMLSVLFIVFCWPVIVWEHTRIVLLGRLGPPTNHPD